MATMGTPEGGEQIVLPSWHEVMKWLVTTGIVFLITFIWLRDHNQMEDGAWAFLCSLTVGILFLNARVWLWFLRDEGTKGIPFMIAATSFVSSITGIVAFLLTYMSTGHIETSMIRMVIVFFLSISIVFVVLLRIVTPPSPPPEN